MKDAKEIIREAGGRVHSDGNIFFTNSEQFLAAALATHAGAAAAEVDEATAMEGGRWVSADDIERMAGELVALATGEAFRPVKMVDAFHTLCAALTSAPAVPEATSVDALMPKQIAHIHSDGGFCWDAEITVAQWPLSLYAEEHVREAIAAALKGVQPGERGEG